MVGPGPARRHGLPAGDLPTVLDAGPRFARAVAGYDRFPVDAYVRWAEDELAAADRAWTGRPRSAALLREVSALEHRLSGLRAGTAASSPPGPCTGPAGHRPDPLLPRFLRGGRRRHRALPAA